MKNLLFVLAIALSLIGAVLLVRLEVANRDLTVDVLQLEAKLGRMPIDDTTRVHLVAIENPDVPPEVASRIDRIWQFRCYLPPGYDCRVSTGGGRVTSDGVYFRGGFNSSWSSPRQESINEMFTLSLKQDGRRVSVFKAFSMSGTSSWDFAVEALGSEDLVVESLVLPGQKSRSFDPKAILPLLRIYDPSSAKTEQILGKAVTTYQGAMVVIVPKSRLPQFKELKQGIVPDGFEDNWVASEATQ